MEYSSVIGIAAIVGPLLSYLYEKVFKNWKGKMASFWLFAGFCLLFGMSISLATGDVAMLKLEEVTFQWNSVEAIIESLQAILRLAEQILKWTGHLLLAGQAFFFTVIDRNKNK